MQSIDDEDFQYRLLKEYQTDCDKGYTDTFAQWMCLQELGRGKYWYKPLGIKNETLPPAPDFQALPAQRASGPGRPKRKTTRKKNGEIEQRIISDTELRKIRTRINDKTVSAVMIVPTSHQFRKKIPPLQRERSELLSLIYTVIKQKKINYLDELKPAEAWRFIVYGGFDNSENLVKSISDSKRSIVLNGGKKITEGKFKKRYRERFIVEIKNTE